MLLIEEGKGSASQWSLDASMGGGEGQGRALARKTETISWEELGLDLVKKNLVLFLFYEILNFLKFVLCS